MGFPYDAVFLGLLVVYLVYSAWQRLDSRYPIIAALVLLVVTAIVDAAGASGEADTLAIFVFFLLAGGVLLLLIDSFRTERGEAAHPATATGSVPPPHVDGPRAH